MLFEGWACTSARRPTTSRATRSTPPTTSTASASARSSTTRCCRSTRASRRSRRHTSARSSTPSTTCRTSSTRSPTNRRAAGPSTAASPRRWGWATRPTGATPPQWQYWVINLVKQYERQMGYDRHPIGMTMQFPVADQTKVNDPLFNSPADWISPGYDDEIFAGGGIRWPGVPSAGSQPARQRRREGHHHRHRPLRAQARATRCGPGSRSCAATTRS